MGSCYTCLPGASPLAAGQMGANAGDKIGDILKRQRLDLHEKKVQNLQVKTPPGPSCTNLFAVCCSI